MLLFVFVIFLTIARLQAKSNQIIQHISANFIDGKWSMKAREVKSFAKSTLTFVSDTSGKSSNENNMRRLQTTGSVAWFNIFPQTNSDPITGLNSTSGEKICFAYSEVANDWTGKTWIAEPLTYKDVKYTTVQSTTINLYFWYYLDLLTCKILDFLLEK